MMIDKEISSILRENSWTLATAESCTGGYLAHRITNIVRSSDYFTRGYIVYSTKSKIELLGIEERILEEYGVYSSQIAKIMADKTRKNSSTTFSLSTTGIAPPGDETSDLEVGLSFIGFSSEHETNSKEIKIKSDSRVEFKKKLTETCLRYFKEKLDFYIA